MSRSSSSAEAHRESSLRATISPVRSGPAAQAAHHVVENYLQYCCDRRTAPRVSELADRMRVDRIELTRWFKRETGHQLAAYMRRRQIGIAEEMLRSTTMTIDEVASRAGFGTVRSMYRAFRREKGISPGAIRTGAHSPVG